MLAEGKREGSAFFAHIDETKLEKRIYGMALAWLRYDLMDDQAQSSRFFGQGCGYCTNSDRTIQTKNL